MITFFQVLRGVGVRLSLTCMSWLGGGVRKPVLPEAEWVGWPSADGCGLAVQRSLLPAIGFAADRGGATFQSEREKCYA